MFCTKYREICHKHGWTTTDNGSTVFVCKETEKGDTYSFHANRENFLDEVGAASDLLSSDVQSYAEGVYQIFHGERSMEECLNAGKFRDLWKCYDKDAAEKAQALLDCIASLFNKDGESQ